MSETHWKKLTNPDYLGSWDFQQGEERVLTIRHVISEKVVDMEKVKSDPKAKKDCIVAHFIENSKPMILNKTNCKMMQELCGTGIIERWAGAKVIIVVEKVRAFGKLEEALRIKKQLPKKSQAIQTQAESIESEPLFCNDCSNVIENFEGFTDRQIATKTLERYGIQLCASCSNRRKKEESEGL